MGLSSPALESSLHHRPSNIPRVLRLRRQTALFVENNVTDQDGGGANAGIVCNKVHTDDEQLEGSVALG